jgi:hypothetical protein
MRGHQQQQVLATFRAGVIIVVIGSSRSSTAQQHSSVAVLAGLQEQLHEPRMQTSEAAPSGRRVFQIADCLMSVTCQHTPQGAGRRTPDHPYSGFVQRSCCVVALLWLKRSHPQGRAAIVLVLPNQHDLHFRAAPSFC